MQWADSIGGDAGAKLLTRFGLIEQALEYDIQTENFDHAFEMDRF